MEMSVRVVIAYKNSEVLPFPRPQQPPPAEEKERASEEKEQRET